MLDHIKNPALQSQKSIEITTIILRKRSGYYRNLGSLSGNETSQRISPLWELLPSNLSWRPIGSRQSKWLANCREACKYELESIIAAPATITSESDTERRLAERAAITAITVMSRSRSQGTEVTIVTGAFPFELSRDITEKFSVMGTLFNPSVREATGSLYQLHSEVEFPSITRS